MPTSPNSVAANRQNEGVYVQLDDLVRMQHKASGFSFLPKQPVHSILSGRHNSKLRGRGLNFEELRNYLPGDDTRNHNRHYRINKGVAGLDGDETG